MVVADVLPDLDTVATPALVVERAKLVANLQAMADRARSLGVTLRPHAKTHKSTVIAELQRDFGARTLTVATLREAEVFAAAGFDDLLLTCPPIGDWRLERLTELAGSIRLRVAVDSAAAVRALDDACRRAGVEVGFLWELDCGAGRFGTIPGGSNDDEIARSAASVGSSRFDGLLAFGGHAYAAIDDEELLRAAEQELHAVTDTADRLAARGVAVEVRSIGTTPTTHVLGSAPGITEIRPGNYVFHDATQTALGLVREERCALTVLATVVSRPDSRRVILDAGSKAVAAEKMTARTSGFGLVRGHPRLRIERMFEEHAIAVSDARCALRIGDRVHVIPNHACAAVNLHTRMLVVEDGAVVDAWPIDARGWARSGVQDRVRA